MSVITVIRTGKRPAVAEGVSTAREAFDQLGLGESLYSGWNITDSSTGETVGLDDSLGSTTLICGDRVEGAA